MKQPTTFAEAMQKLEDINRWFQEEDIDLDEGLQKLREGKELLGICRNRLTEVENEFVKIKEEFQAGETEPPAVSERTPSIQNDDDLPF